MSGIIGEDLDAIERSVAKARHRLRQLSLNHWDLVIHSTLAKKTQKPLHYMSQEAAAWREGTERFEQAGGDLGFSVPGPEQDQSEATTPAEARKD